MVVINLPLAVEVDSKLTHILGLWALYRTRGPRGNRVLEPQMWELWRRSKDQPLERVASWHLEQLPGCKWIGVSCHVVVEEKWRGKGLGHLTLSIREHIAKDSGYSALFAATRDNIAEEKCLRKAGWEEFENPALLPEAPELLNFWKKNL